MKITIIGAGSSYTPELIEGIINNYKYLNLQELWLNDIKEGEYKLNIIYELTKRMFLAKNIKVKIFKSFNKINSLKKADFVIIQLRVGFLEARINDERIAIKHGMLGQETNGIVGMFKAFRTIPIVFEIVNLVKKYANKNSWIINFSNPASMVTEAVHRYLKFKRFVGVCNVPIHIEMMLAQFYDIDKKKIKINWVGLNHLVFGTKVKINNIDKTTRAISDLVDPLNVEKFTMRNIAPIPWEPTFINALNLLPCPYFRYFIQYKEMLDHMIEDYNNNNLRAELVKQVENDLFKKYEDPQLNEKPKELEKRGGAFYSKVAIEVLVGLAGGPSKDHAVNYPNNGTIKNYPKDWVIEVSSKITRDSIVQYKDIKEVPSKIFGLIMEVKNYELLAIKAAVEGNYGLGLVALNLNPFSISDVINKKAYDELLEVHKKYLPNFYKKGK